MERPRTCPDIATIARLCSIPEDCIEAVFIGGSRCFGNSTPSSDFDLTAVLSSHAGPLSSPASRKSTSHLPQVPIHEFISQKLGETGDVDVHFLSSALWRQMLYDNNVHALTCECLPAEFVLRRATPRLNWVISLMRLKHQVYRYTHDHEQKARTLWEKNQRASSVKCVVHALRVARFGLQLATRGVVYDLSVANETLATLSACAPSHSSWASFVSAYQPIWTKDMEAFESVVNGYKLSNAFLHQMSPAETLASFLTGRTPEMLKREVDVQACFPFPEFPELMQLHLDPISSPHRFEFTRLCSGTVVDVSRGFLPVCLPISAIPHYDDDLYSEEKFVPTLDMQSVSIYHKRNALSAFLFAYKGKWMVAAYAGLNIYAQGLCLRYKCEFPTGISKAVSEVFWAAWKSAALTLPPVTDGRQFFFSLSEFATPSIQLIGARQSNGDEIPPASVAAEFGWPVVVDERARLNATNLPILAEQLCAAEYEGFVACDASFRRVSYKSQAYRNLTYAAITPFIPSQDERELHFFILARHLRFDLKRIEHFCSIAPQLSVWLMAVQTKANAWLSKANELLSSINPSCTQAEFSKAVAQAPPSMKRLLFEVRKDGRFKCVIDYVCNPEGFGDAKLSRRLCSCVMDE